MNRSQPSEEIVGDDPTLTRLIVEYGEACNSFAVRQATAGEVNLALVAAVAYVARHYVRSAVGVSPAVFNLRYAESKLEEAMGGTDDDTVADWMGDTLAAVREAIRALGG